MSRTFVVQALVARKGFSLFPGLVGVSNGQGDVPALKTTPERYSEFCASSRKISYLSDCEACLFAGHPAQL